MNYAYLAGHDSFYLREGWLRKGILALYEDASIFSGPNLSKAIDQLGVGANMVKAIKYWLEVCFLVEKDHSGKTNLSSTWLTQCIMSHDPYFQKNETLWLLHYFYSNNVPLWKILFQKNNLARFTKAQAKHLITMDIADQQIHYSASTISSALDVFLSTYIWDRSANSRNPEDNLISPLNRLRLLGREKEQYFYRSVSNKDVSPLFLYFLLFVDGKREIAMTDAIELIKNHIPMISAHARAGLELLELNKMIRVERAAGLNMIYDKSGLPPVDLVKVMLGGVK